jgi:hypothetical protein
MKNTTKKLSILFLVLVPLTLLTSACKANISRNSDGSFTVETTVSQQQLQEAISDSIADPLIQEITISLQNGYILVTGAHQRLNDTSKTDSLSFRVDLGVSNGQLTASISNAQLDSHPVEQSRVDHWNQTLVNRIANLAQKNLNSTLQTVIITPSAVTMTWNVTR